MILIGKYKVEQKLFLVSIIIFIFLIVGLINPRFFSFTNIMAILQQISVLGILTMAMALVLIIGGVDLSIGTIMVLSGVIISRSLEAGMPIAIAIMLGLCAGILCGILNGLLISKTKCIPLIITLGTSNLFFGLSLIISQGKFLHFKGVFNIISDTKIFGLFPSVLLLLFLVVAITYLLLNYTKFGRRVVAIGGNEENAYLSGINVDVYKIAIYAFSGFISSIASIALVSRLDSIIATAGQGYELSALTAAIIGGVTFEGGRGSIEGAFLGVIMIGLVNNAMTVLSVNSYLQTAVTGVIIVIAVVVSNADKILKRNN